jgi:hypothetical protein
MVSNFALRQRSDYNKSGAFGTGSLHLDTVPRGIILERSSDS